MLPSIDLRKSLADTRDLVAQLREILAQPAVVADHGRLVGRKLPAIARGLRTILKTDKTEVLSIGTMLEDNARLYADQPALRCGDQVYTHHELNAHANRYANFYLAHGVGKGDSVAVLLENRAAIVFAVAGAVKLGAIAAVINTKQRKRVLVHSLGLCDASLYVVGEELWSAFTDIRAELDGATRERVFYFRDDDSKSGPPATAGDGDKEVAAAATTTPAELADVRLGDPCFYVYTSGTTGMPKASVMSHFRWIKASAAFGKLSLDIVPTDVIFVSLPLYHNNALSVTWSAAASGGACMAIQRKFSASNFWRDIRRYNANSFCYIGELCRYLMNQPERPDDKDNPVTKIVGNGLRPDIWKQFKARFDIDEVYEFYGASECNIIFVNALNIDCTVGLCPAAYAIVEYDVDAGEPVRDERGHLIKVSRGGTGLMLAEVSEKYAFDGYTNPAESEKKLIRNAFVDGDVWFNSGDLLKDMGFRHAQFVDRLGDTFRWKSENVSTNEVAEVLNTFAQIDEATVYGVEIPDTEGRAGMAALVANVATEEFDFAALVDHIEAELPAYARPVFLRFRAELEVTATLKQKKVNLRKQGFDVTAIDEPIYVMLPRSDTYTRLDEALFARIMAGEIPF